MINIEDEKYLKGLSKPQYRPVSFDNSDTLSDITNKFGTNLGIYSGYYYVKNTTLKSIKNKLQNITDKQEINLSATLYFDKGCTFPRFKLQETDFKRCVKPSKADYIVIPRDILKDCTNYSVDPKFKYKFEYDNCEYLVSTEFYSFYTNLRELCVPIDFQDLVYCSTKSVAQTLYNIKFVYDKPFIYEDDLELLISKDLEKLDEESLMSIYDMLKSSDESSIELGCKLLSSFDVFEVPLAISMLLFLTQNNWIKNKGANSTTFKSSLQALNYPLCGYRYIDYVFKEHAIKCDKDRQLAKKLIEPWIRQTIQDACNFNLDNCPFKIELEIEIE